MSTRLTLIVAATPTHGIGKSGGLPWRLPQEMKYFARITTLAPENKRNSVIMGRNTWESIPLRFRPLPGRANVVLSSKQAYTLGVDGDAATLSTLASALSDLAQRPEPIHRHFIIGGAGLYDETLALPPTSSTYVDRVLLTRVLDPSFECDTFVPALACLVDEGLQGWRRAPHEELSGWAQFDVPAGIQEEKGVHYEFQMWVRD
ncbi:hypothetical protein PENSPDRAFT_742329 [Peniophora sp. CONT]|nr:hypothetical protein PENSPDRAFT_742329 [Peniophora sp. CONT]